jgi:hypothetical protein
VPSDPVLLGQRVIAILEHGQRDATTISRSQTGARGVSRGLPAGVPTWWGWQRIQRLDISFAPSWIEQDQVGGRLHSSGH